MVWIMPPLTARHLVGDLDPVAIRAPDVDTDGMAMVRYMLDLYVLLFNAEVQLLQVVEAVHIPSHVVESHLPFLGPWGILSHFYQGDFMGVAQVRRHEGSPSGRKPVGVETQEVLIPRAGAFRCAHKDVDVSYFSRLVTHNLPPLCVPSSVTESIITSTWTTSLGVHASRLVTRIFVPPGATQAALPYPILRRLSSTSESRATPRARGATGEERWAE